LLITQLASTVREPQQPEQGPEPSWNEAVFDLAAGDQTIGIVGCKLRYLIAAIEDTVLTHLPEGQRIESVWRLHRAAYFGLETAARAVAEEIARVAFHSTVTGLRNRAAFERDIERNVAENVPFHIVSIDMDGLKIINDRHGHQAGNDALRSLSVRLSRELGESDTAYHISGDEFYVVTRTTDGNYVEGLMSRVGQNEDPGFSYGAAYWSDSGADWTEVEKLSDERMQENKNERKARGEAPERPC